MATTRDQLQATLAVHDAAALRLILTASEVDPRDARTPAELAARIADAIWWNYCTPLGYLAEKCTFEEVVRHLARKLGVADRVDPDVPVWEQIRALTLALVPEASAATAGISLGALDDATRDRLGPSWTPSLAWGGGATTSFATRWGSARVLALLKTPIGRLLPLLPVVGPWVGVVRTGISGLHFVAGPLGIAMTVLSMNSALGSNYQRLVPLVLGVGALGPQGVSDAQVVTAAPKKPAPAPVEADLPSVATIHEQVDPAGLAVAPVAPEAAAEAEASAEAEADLIEADLRDLLEEELSEPDVDLAEDVDSDVLDEAEAETVISAIEPDPTETEELSSDSDPELD